MTQLWNSGFGVWRRAGVPALVPLIVANFLFYAVAGPNGLLRWGDYHHREVERSQELQTLQARQTRLAHDAALLDPRHADPDLADELIRRDLRLVRPDEVVLPMQD